MSEAPPRSDDTTRTDAAFDTKERFAADLRKLRLDGGNPTLKRLQDETGISRSVLSEAFAGRSLPTARTVDGVVRVCGGDTASWLDRRDLLAGLAVPPAVRAVDETAARGVVGFRLRTVVLIAAIAFLVGAAASGATASILTAQLSSSGLATTPQTGERIEVATGVDPDSTACVADARVAAADSRVDDALVELIWSSACDAGWARITRLDANDDGNSLTIAIYPETSPAGPDRQEATARDVQAVSTALIVRPSPGALLCAEGSFTVGGESFDVGDPICI